MDNQNDLYDCIIIGAGPGGLLACIYFTRFKANILLIDDQLSRAALIPVSHNYPGAKHPKTGADIILDLKDQLNQYEYAYLSGTVTHLKKNTKKNYFIATCNGNIYKSKNIILATGLVDIEPKLPNLEKAVFNGLIRHCVICDGYEIQNQKLAILGHGKHVIDAAKFLWQYSKRLTILTMGAYSPFTASEIAFLKRCNIPVVREKFLKIEVKNKQICSIQLLNKDKYIFDVIYSALGAVPNSKLAKKLGAKLDKQNYILVNRDQETSVSGLYAIGDVTKGLKQMCVAHAQGAIAATAIFGNLLKKK